MKKLNKKGFTIVELVIVIAVIGILAGVLIPTFTIVVRKANESAAIQALDSARKELLTIVDATADDFADVDTNYAYQYTVDKKGQNIKELAGYYQFVGGEWKQVAAPAADKEAWEYTKVDAFITGTTTYYTDKSGATTTIADADAFDAYEGTLYTRAQININGVLVYKIA
ncbi:MAG: type II secretion system protein [Clostridia bacterium]|nr:type II secretion system protein [Clostridia bacterium]